jgi:hypothetical protein
MQSRFFATPAIYRSLSGACLWEVECCRSRETVPINTEKAAQRQLLSTPLGSIFLTGVPMPTPPFPKGL